MSEKQREALVVAIREGLRKVTQDINEHYPHEKPPIVLSIVCLMRYVLVAAAPTLISMTYLIIVIKFMKSLTPRWILPNIAYLQGNASIARKR